MDKEKVFKMDIASLEHEIFDIDDEIETLKAEKADKEEDMSNLLDEYREFLGEKEK